MLPARGILGSRRRTTDVAPIRRRPPNISPHAPPWIARAAAAADRDASADSPLPSASTAPSSLAALLAPRLPPRLPAAVFWDADNVRPSGGAARVPAVRRRLADLAQQLHDAGSHVVSATAYGNAATLRSEGGGGGNDNDDDGDDDGGEQNAGADTPPCRPRLVVTNSGKRQSADMALLSDLTAFVSQHEQQQQQPSRSGTAAAVAAVGVPAALRATISPSCLVLLVADDAGYAGACAWASAAPRSAVVVACGASAGRRARYALPTAAANPLLHPLARAGAAVVVPWVAGGGGGGPDAAAAWINPEGLLSGGGGREGG